MKWVDAWLMATFFVAIFLCMVVLNCWFLTTLRVNSGQKTDGTWGCVVWTMDEYKEWVIGDDS